MSQFKGSAGRGLWFVVCTGFVSFTWLATSFVNAEEAAAGQRPVASLDFSILDTKGVAHSLKPDSTIAAQVYIFLSTDCPVANGYVPELNRQFRELQTGKSSVRFYGVISDRQVTQATAVKHSAEYKIEFPVLFDASGLVARALNPAHTPEAFVLDGSGRIAYRGRIDDVYADLGKRRTEASERTLADALAAVLAGREPANPVTKSVGCMFESDEDANPAGKVTYTRDIAPILQANCMNCHRDGQVAPFPLVNYTDAAKRAKQIIHVTESRFMPPWRPEPNFGHFANERRLSDRELSLLSEWATAGTPEGNAADLPPAPSFAEGWLLGEPDLVIKMPEPFEIRADGPDIFRNFVIPVDLDSDKLVRAIEFRPGNPRVVHHTILYLDNTGAARKKDEADPGPGYSSFGGPGFLPSGSIGGWSPGGTPQPLRDGLGRPMKKGSDIVMQIHYHPTGKPEVDQSTVGIHYVKSGTPRPVVAIMIIDRGLYIPAGTDQHEMSGTYTLPMDVTLVGVIPHMHLLGREMKATATLPDGTVDPQIWIKDWNFNWQDQYVFDQPRRLPKGTRLDLSAVYDNTDKNPVNPNSPPKLVTWGEQTTDEMFICFYLVTTDKPDQLLPLIVDNFRALGGKLRAAQGKRATGAATP